MPTCFLPQDTLDLGSEQTNVLWAHLADDVPVGKTDNHPVLGCVILVLVLYHKALASKVISLSL